MEPWIPLFNLISLLLVLVVVVPAQCGPHVFLSSAMAHVTANSGNQLQTYIVHVEEPARINNNADSSSSEVEREKWYKSFLPERLLLGSGEDQLVYAYHHVTSGFAAQLTEEEITAMEEKDGFLLAYPDTLVPLQTTYSPSFLGLEGKGNHGLWNTSNYGSGVIVGVLDTGIAPNHASFSDKGMPPPPAKWKGRCEFPKPGCNRKLIGARNFIRGKNAMHGINNNIPTNAGASEPPYDTEGHGTHTAGTAAGQFVQGAGVYGNALGVAVGMAPHAHLSIYKVCSEDGCPTSDILAGLDAAVSDGVDILSLSLGGPSRPFYQDGIAIGTFGAIQKGVFVSCAAGNSGPSDSTLSNEEPWILTVGASTMDRIFRTTVTLGDGQQFDGESLNQAIPFPTISPVPLVYAGRSQNTATCGTLSGVNVRGKVVVCDMGGGVGRVAKGANVKAAGGVAMILANAEEMGWSTLAEAHVLPASHVSYEAAEKIKTYIKSTAKPVATITPKGTLYGVPPPAPMVAYFSSRGPSQASPNILKPDIIGPGVNVLAAWPFQVGPIKASDTFNVISGTSMSTPHLSGIAALLKAAHPDWSPAAIKSAIMTSADIITRDGEPIPDQLMQPYNVFATGVGHVNPLEASDPGLVFDIDPENYIAYLCGLGYNNRQVSAITRRAVDCSSYPVGVDLNYPSITVSLDANGEASATRFVTNVGLETSEYKVIVQEPPGVRVFVEPDILRFTPQIKVAKISVKIQRVDGDNSYAVGSLAWASSDKVVRSPLLVVPSSSMSGSLHMASK